MLTITVFIENFIENFSVKIFLSVRKMDGSWIEVPLGKLCVGIHYELIYHEGCL